MSATIRLLSKASTQASRDHQFDVMDINGRSLHVSFDVANIKWSEVCQSAAHEGCLMPAGTAAPFAKLWSAVAIEPPLWEGGGSVPVARTQASHAAYRHHSTALPKRQLCRAHSKVLRTKIVSFAASLLTRRHPNPPRSQSAVTFLLLGGLMGDSWIAQSKNVSGC
jgi:hypothetical protein